LQIKKRSLRTRLIDEELSQAEDSGDSVSIHVNHRLGERLWSFLRQVVPSLVAGTSPASSALDVK
jgi:hypothetical protein